MVTTDRAGASRPAGGAADDMQPRGDSDGGSERGMAPAAPSSSGWASQDTALVGRQQPTSGPMAASSAPSRRLTGAGGSGVRVFLRVRPLLQRELEAGVCVSVNEAENRVKVFSGGKAIESACDGVWDETTTQAAMFESLAESTSSLLHGLNVTVLAYGQTGTGKTFTMLGGNYLNTGDKAASMTESNEIEAAMSAHAGVIPRLVTQLFNQVNAVKLTGRLPGEEAPLGGQGQIMVSYLEIYNEKVYDLLNPKQTRNLRGDDKDLKQSRINLEVRDNHIPGLTMCTVSTAAEVMLLLRAGNRLRAVRHTNMNQHSSRSHAIVQITLQRSHGGRTVQSKMNLVDLAGSERWDIHDTSAARVAEMTSINQGLSALASVVASLQRGQSRTGKQGAPAHVPYRDSKITHVLMNSLGGNCKTTLIATLSPSLISAEENISTMRFADRVRAIQNHAVAKERNDPGLVLEAKEAEIQRLRGLLSMVAGSDAVNVHTLKESFDAVSRELEHSRQELAAARRAVEEERQKRLEAESQLEGRAGSESGVDPRLAHMATFRTVSANLYDAVHGASGSPTWDSGPPSPALPPIFEAEAQDQDSPFHPPELQHPAAGTQAQPKRAELPRQRAAEVPESLPAGVDPNGALAGLLSSSQGAAMPPPAEALPRPSLLSDRRASDEQIEPLLKILTDDSPVLSPIGRHLPEPYLPSASAAASYAAADIGIPNHQQQQQQQHAAAASQVQQAGQAHQPMQHGLAAAPVAAMVSPHSTSSPVQPYREQLPPQPAVRTFATQPQASAEHSAAQQQSPQRSPAQAGPVAFGFKGTDAGAGPLYVQHVTSEPLSPTLSGAAQRWDGPPRQEEAAPQKELFAIGGILAEITQIRSELRQLIKGQHYGPQYHQEYQDSQQQPLPVLPHPYGSQAPARGGHPRGSKTHPVAPAGVRHAYASHMHPAPGPGRHSTAPNKAQRRQSLPAVPARNGRAGPTGRPSPGSAPEKQQPRRQISQKSQPRISFPPVASQPRTSQAAQPGSKAPQKASPPRTKKAAPSYASPPGRSRIPGGAPTRARQSPKPAGAQSGGNVGEWIYIMGSRASHVKAAKMAELDSVARFNLADKNSVAHMFI
eukprot:jgi/Tetstr1/447426/TSEL_003686.t1